MSSSELLNAEALLISYTLFANPTPTSKLDRDDVPWSEFVDRIRGAPTYIDKIHCPLISLAQYGSQLTARGCIRHAANVARVYGCEVDYDEEQIQPVEAAGLLQEANLRAVIYTSPSHRPERPRWRVLLPFSEPAPPEKRAEYVGRVNRVLGGIASRESFVLSQSFFIGRVRGVAYEVLETSGRCIDLSAELEPLYHIRSGNDAETPFDSTTDAELRESFNKREGRYQAMLKLSSRWAARGMAPDDIEHLLLQLLGGNPVNADGINLRTRARPLAESAVQKFGESRRHPNKGDAGGRRVIEVRDGELPQLVRQAEAALVDAQAGIYQRAGLLVRIVQLDTESNYHGIHRAAGSTLIQEVTLDFMTLALSRAATWERYDNRRKAMKLIDAPVRVSRALMSAVGEWRLPLLTGVTAAPTLRADGSLLDVPGHDAASGLYGTFDHATFPTINTRPSREQAVAAVAVLQDLFSECAFAGGPGSAGAAVALAAVITTVIRNALPTAPAFGLSAHKAGSGKTTLAKAIAQIAVGREPPVLALSDNEAELRKTLLAILIAGDACVLVDNVAHAVDSPALCAVLTSASYSDRMLGVNQRLIVPTTCTWLITGNHLEFVGDLTSRVLLVMLDPEVEHPEARAFLRDMAEYVAANRGELVTAALTIPLAYIAANEPPMQVQRSRYPEWDRLVRRPLLWLGVADPLETQAELRSADSKRETLVALLQCWHLELGDGTATVQEVIRKAVDEDQIGRPALLEALQAAAADREGTVNPRKLGKYLKRNCRTIEGGLRLEAVGKNRSTCRNEFRVASVTGVISVSSNPTREMACNTPSTAKTVAGNAGNAALECARCAGEGCGWCK